MPIITFANTKGGAGKTTAVLILATELARRGNRVTVLDADPRGWISRWHSISGAGALLSVVPGITEDTIEQAATAGANTFVAGSSVFNGDPAGQIARLRAAAELHAHAH